MLKTKTGRLVELPSDEEDALINAGIAADPDTYELSDTEFLQLKPYKATMTVSVDYDVLAAVQAMGEDWQGKVNAILRDWLSEHAV